MILVKFKILKMILLYQENQLLWISKTLIIYKAFLKLRFHRLMIKSTKETLFNFILLMVNLYLWSVHTVGDNFLNYYYYLHYRVFICNYVYCIYCWLIFLLYLLLACFKRNSIFNWDSNFINSKPLLFIYSNNKSRTCKRLPGR